MPGFMHPVEDLYLEDCLRLTGYEDALALQSGADKAEHKVRGSKPT